MEIILSKQNIRKIHRKILYYSKCPKIFDPKTRESCVMKINGMQWNIGGKTADERKIVFFYTEIFS